MGRSPPPPFNDSITGEEERRRYGEIFIPALEPASSVPLLSIDTYRPETFREIFVCLREKGFEGDVIWNDVSGVLDDKTFEVLASLDVGYVYTHNRVGRREEVGQHLKYAKKGDIVKEVVSYFQNGVERLKKVIPIQKIWLDPGFGFSKEIAQNWGFGERNTIFDG